MIAQQMQRARHLQSVLADEATHALTMQLVIAELPETEQRVIEHVVQTCREARLKVEYPLVSWVAEYE